MSTNTGPATNQCIYHYWCRSRGQWHNIDFPCESRFKCVDRNGAQSLNIKVSFIEELIMKVPVLVISPIVSKYCGVNIGTTWRWEDWTNMISTSIMVDMCRRLENYKRDKLHVACRHWTLIPPIYLALSYFGLAYALLVETNIFFQNLSLFSQTLHFEHPSVLRWFVLFLLNTDILRWWRLTNEIKTWM